MRSAFFKMKKFNQNSCGVLLLPQELCFGSSCSKSHLKCVTFDDNKMKDAVISRRLKHKFICIFHWKRVKVEPKLCAIRKCGIRKIKCIPIAQIGSKHYLFRYAARSCSSMNCKTPYKRWSNQNHLNCFHFIHCPFVRLIRN